MAEFLLLEQRRNRLQGLTIPRVAARRGQRRSPRSCMHWAQLLAMMTAATAELPQSHVDTLSRSSGTTTADSYSSEGMPSKSRRPPNSERLRPSRSVISSGGLFFRGRPGASRAPSARAAWLQPANGIALSWAFSPSATAASSGYGRVSPASSGYGRRRWLGRMGSVAGGSTNHPITVCADGYLGR